MDNLGSVLAEIALTRKEIGSEQLSGKRLTNLLLHQTCQELDVVFVGKASARVDL